MQSRRARVGRGEDLIQSLVDARLPLEDILLEPVSHRGLRKQFVPTDLAQFALRRPGVDLPATLHQDLHLGLGIL